jgi:hypothetical protein
MRPPADDDWIVDNVTEISQPEAGQQTRNTARKTQVRQNAAFYTERLVHLMDGERRKCVSLSKASIANLTRGVHKLFRRIEFRQQSVYVLCHKP